MKRTTMLRGFGCGCSGEQLPLALPTTATERKARIVAAVDRFERRTKRGRK
jgi:hypothetical protein